MCAKGRSLTVSALIKVSLGIVLACEVAIAADEAEDASASCEWTFRVRPGGQLSVISKLSGSLDGEIPFSERIVKTIRPYQGVQIVTEVTKRGLLEYHWHPDIRGGVLVAASEINPLAYHVFKPMEKSIAKGRIPLHESYSQKPEYLAAYQLVEATIAAYHLNALAGRLSWSVVRADRFDDPSRRLILDRADWGEDSSFPAGDGTNLYQDVRRPNFGGRNQDRNGGTAQEALKAAFDTYLNTLSAERVRTRLWRTVYPDELIVRQELEVFVPIGPVVEGELGVGVALYILGEYDREQFAKHTPDEVMADRVAEAFHDDP